MYDFSDPERLTLAVLFFSESLLYDFSEERLTLGVLFYSVFPDSEAEAVLAPEDYYLAYFTSLSFSVLDLLSSSPSKSKSTT